MTNDDIKKILLNIFVCSQNKLKTTLFLFFVCNYKVEHYLMTDFAENLFLLLLEIFKASNEIRTQS